MVDFVTDKPTDSFDAAQRVHWEKRGVKVIFLASLGFFCPQMFENNNKKEKEKSFPKNK